MAHHRHDRARQMASGVHAEPPLREGYLYKCSQFDPAEWKRRRFVLRRAPEVETADGAPGVLLQYNCEAQLRDGVASRERGGMSVGGSIELNAAATVRARPDVHAASWGDKGAAMVHKFCLEVTTPARTYLLDAANDADLQQWLNVLESSRAAWGQQPGPDERTATV